jgi:hypothetical protein
MILDGDPKSDTFHQEDNPEEYGVTKEILFKEKYIESLGYRIRFVDIPGTGDPTIDP